MINVAQKTNPDPNEYEKVGQALGLGVGMVIWVGIWAAIAGPAFILYLLIWERKNQFQLRKFLLPCAKSVGSIIVANLSIAQTAARLFLTKLIGLSKTQ